MALLDPQPPYKLSRGEVAARLAMQAVMDRDAALHLTTSTRQAEAADAISITVVPVRGLDPLTQLDSIYHQCWMVLSSCGGYSLWAVPYRS